MIEEPLARYDLGDTPSVLGTRAVEPSPDLTRVLGLPERPPIEHETVRALSRALNSKDGMLRPHQALALRELYEVGGFAAPLRVGAGKTLIALLAPTLLDAQRPVLVTRARLIDEARIEHLNYRAAGWDVRLPRLLSYEKISQPSGEWDLDRLAPDLLIFDEAHKLKNLKSAASVRRVARAIQTYAPRVAMLSGSLFSADLMKFWHVLLWALGPSAPVPLNYQEAKLWSRALNPKNDGFDTVSRGALDQLGDFWEHLSSRRGIVPTLGEDCKARIALSRWEPDLPPALSDLITEVAQTRTRPDGELLEDTEYAECLTQLAQGFWYCWDPLPPDHWREARKAYYRYERAVVEAHLDGFDSPFAVVQALDHGTRRAPDHELGVALRQRWLAVRDEYDPAKNRGTVWIDDTPLRAAADCPQGTLIWTRHAAALERLGQLGVPTFGGGGADPRRRHKGKTCALSIAAHATGKNYQAWNRNRVLTLPASSELLEQLMGRTHRPGQKAEQVSFEMYTGTDYARDVLSRVRSAALADGEAARFEFKITKGTWS